MAAEQLAPAKHGAAKGTTSESYAAVLYHDDGVRKAEVERLTVQDVAEWVVKCDAAVAALWVHGQLVAKQLASTVDYALAHLANTVQAVHSNHMSHQVLIVVHSLAANHTLVRFCSRELRSFTQHLNELADFHAV